LIYGPIIADILESFTSPPVQPLLLADVTYGACCIDDYTAKSMGAEMIVHYGHSCLSELIGIVRRFDAHGAVVADYRSTTWTSVPVSQTTLRTLYIFVEIQVDPLHLALSVRRNFPSTKSAFRRQVLDTAPRSDDNAAEIEIGLEDTGTPAADVDPTQPTRLALVSTIQFISAVQDLRDALTEPLPPIDGKTSSDSNSAAMTTTTSQTRDSLLRARAEEIGVWRGKYDIVVPQVRPLSPGEVLGCTAPKLDDNVDALM
jgi:2-(3-amino-3-carboxypropyl)histidine synthase